LVVCFMIRLSGSFGGGLVPPGVACHRNLAIDEPDAVLTGRHRRFKKVS
jgi:hypothetical protein